MEDDEILTAIENSILHWRKNSKGDFDGIDTVDCALCEKFHNHVPWPSKCAGCPILIYTGRPGCAGTPYPDVFTEFYYGSGETGINEESKEMLKFLKEVMAWYLQIRHLW